MTSLHADLWLAGVSLNSLVQDFAARQKVGGTSLNYFLVKQFATLPPAAFDVAAAWDSAVNLTEWLKLRVDEVTFTDWALKAFSDEPSDVVAPYRWNPGRRFSIRAELDAAFFHLYGITRDDADYILDTFTVLRGKEEARYNEFRTKRVVLEIFDAMQQAIDTGERYQTILDPEPGHGPRHEPQEVAP